MPRCALVRRLDRDLGATDALSRRTQRDPGPHTAHANPAAVATGVPSRGPAALCAPPRRRLRKREQVDADRWHHHERRRQHEAGLPLRRVGVRMMLSSVTGALLAAVLALPLLAVRAALSWRPPRVLRWGLTRGRASLGPRLSPPVAARLVEIAARRLPFRFTCLEQACAVLLLCDRTNARLVLGVAGPPETFRAHAWVEFEGRVILGAAGMAGVRPLTAGPAAEAGLGACHA
jgi:hypothetical protein